MANNRPIAGDQNAVEDRAAIPNRPRYRTNGHQDKVGMPEIKRIGCETRNERSRILIASHGLNVIPLVIIANRELGSQTTASEGGNLDSKRQRRVGNDLVTGMGSVEVVRSSSSGEFQARFDKDAWVFHEAALKSYLECDAIRDGFQKSSASTSP